MEKTSFENKLFGVLKQNPDFLSVEGEVLKDRVIDSAYKADRKLIELLLENAEVKKKFFSEIQGHWVFNINDFVMFVQDKHFLNDSYTKYKNKIGLTIDGKFLNERKEVALVWPFKDTVLEGGMTKEDQKKKEIFFNEILAQDEIDKLLAPKVLTNWKRYTAKGEEEVKELKRDENRTIKENLIIKGNNLLALHTLKEQFRGKVKLIYIDPPYNTELDSFSYNDNFSHSTWLTFMKNRLEVARELLTDDGTIFVQLDWHEAHYLKILLDTVFGREKLINEIVWCYSGPGSPDMKQFNRKHDTIFWYRKGENWTFNKDAIRVPYKDPNQSFRKAFDSGDGWNESDLVALREKGKVPEDWWEFSVAARLRVDGKKRTGYLTEKPLKLMERIIKASTDEGDIVLDFFAGAGTTGYVANELKRRFILVEQLENTQAKLKARFEGRNYIYCELMNYNESFIEEIENAKDTKSLSEIWKQMKEKAFFKHNFEMQEFEKNIEELKKLDLQKQKQVLFGVLDKNQLYVNYSEVEDKKFKVEKKDKEINKEFYDIN